MKCLQVLCTLIIFWFGAIHAQADSNLYARCTQQWHVIPERENSCKDRTFLNYNTTLIQNEFKAVMTRYSGDNSEFQTLINKYCPIVLQVLDCNLIMFEMDDDCIDQRYKLSLQQKYNISKGLMNYLCADSGAAVLPLLQNNAFNFVLENDEFEECMSLLFEESTDDLYRSKIATCDGIDKAFECAPDRGSSNLIAFTNGLRLVFRQAVECA